MVRYPHTGQFITSKSQLDADGHAISVEATIDVKCRFEREYKGKASDRKGTVYVPLSEGNKITSEEAVFSFEGRRFKLAGLMAYQTHLEIWVE